MEALRRVQDLAAGMKLCPWMQPNSYSAGQPLIASARLLVFGEAAIALAGLRADPFDVAARPNPEHASVVAHEVCRDQSGMGSSNTLLFLFRQPCRKHDRSST